ncbi:hypothetical protein [Rarobacter faecitabidus]|uniref:Ribbon-helix-helix CopG family protein n=1 Tax=Rarobacter faecitabidus TaxID=13243 RepID=A0A542ZPM9_RARFA|nr:hypothetical protein [Rarobacter faecitabidus]TQL62189.1 hypothetical protein FB461_1828 [Rarobacter faecitabidus]
MKNITVTVPDDVYRAARIAAAERDRSVSALVTDYLVELAQRHSEFSRRLDLQHKVQAQIVEFSAQRLTRDEIHDRAVR